MYNFIAPQKKRSLEEMKELFLNFLLWGKVMTPTCYFFKWANIDNVSFSFFFF